MKKLILLIVTFFAFATVGTYAKDPLEKELKKEYKKKMKEYEKGGWVVFGSSRSLEVSLLKHYEKLNEGGDDVQEVVGIASQFKSKNVGHQTAINNACNTYARSAGSHIKGRIVSDMASNGDDVLAEFDHFYAAYETQVEKEIKGELSESYSVIKDNGDGTYELQSYFIVNESAATKARIRAYENALLESQAAQNYADQVSKFVQEGFAVEEE